MTFMPSSLIFATMEEIDAYCKPSGTMVSAAPGQLTPVYVTFSSELLRIQGPSLRKCPLGHPAIAIVTAARLTARCEKCIVKSSTAFQGSEKYFLDFREQRTTEL